MHDYSGYVEAPTGGELAELAGLADELQRAQKVADDLELELKRAVTKVAYLAEDRIPELMSRLGLTDFKTRSGLKIETAEKVFANISEQNREAAFAWMDQNGHGGMIKREIGVAFNRDQQDAARALQEKLRDDGYPGVREKCAIHPSTLRAWARKRLKAGEEIPDSVSIERKLVAKVKN